MRDAMLSVSESLSLQAGGPGFKPYIAPEANLARNIQGEGYPKDAKDDATNRRRSVYMFHKRVVQYPLMQAFDAPDAQQSCGRRMNTTVAPQALALMNDPFVRRRAKEMATRLQRVSPDSIEAQVGLAFQLGLNRAPESEELTTACDFIKHQSTERIRRDESEASLLALTDFCHALFGLNEFVYVD